MECFTGVDEKHVLASQEQLTKISLKLEGIFGRSGLALPIPLCEISSAKP